MRWLSTLFGSIFLIFILANSSHADLYTVQSGDSLIKISKELGLKPAAIKKLNPNINWLKIRPGEKIKVPSISKNISNTSNSNIYIVKSGDSLIKISKKFDIKPSLIKKYNPGVNWLKIRPGDKIKIPALSKSASYEEKTDRSGSVYVVKSGDSLIKISKKLNIKPIAIKRLNPNINWLKIRPGDKISIPEKTKVETAKKEPTAKPGTYTTKKNDSLAEVSRKMNVSIEDLERLNPDIDWSKLKPNKKINLPQNIEKTAKNNQEKENSLAKTTVKSKKIENKIPKKTAKVILPNQLKKELIKKNCSLKPGDVGDGYYVVKRGDTLSSIARRFGLTLNRLMKLNPNKSRFIKPGDLIVLPGELTQKIMLSKKENLYIPPKYLVYSTPYKIKKGDTLYKIARRFGTKVYVIKMLNNLGSNILRAGSYIFVPNKNMAHKSKIELEYSLLRERRKALIHYAERFLGRPYRFGGDSLLHGIDCSAFVQKIYERFIRMKLPRTAEEQYRTVGVFVPLSRIQVGDLLFFHTMSYAKVTHVGIYIGHNRFIHAAGRRSGIKISRLSRYYLKRLVGVKRILSISNKYAYFRHRPG